ncbi:hemoglobin/transferrin/lactoferrin receptor protein [Desulfobotulus alkaliphilus]|uniref:Hemoglobin/transferrin/lactoferrin receptor protein n=1 Tax=Desulfobotulus alkaliphilus TaxID=622671 RepID=A0A562RD50_9BACT|nr:TonB-dependent receptor [Desulfobotulus alkaliphilus]TWI66958.1 hemoglobin/transferrin/lactoferrin receptor protein [Desulfobotulus alkaliphilus]
MPGFTLCQKLTKIHKKLRCKIYILAWILFLFSIFPSPAPASQPENTEDIIVLDRVIVSARGSEAPISQTPGGTALMDAETLLRSNPVGLTDALTRIPGLSASPDSPWGSEINIRGLGRNRVILLIDGARVHTSTDINARFGLVDTRDIERVEILKGPVSALYGSGSIGGVVNIITKKGKFSSAPEVKGALSSTFRDNPEGYGIHGRIQYNTPDYWLYASGNRRDHQSYKDGRGNEIHNSQFEDQGGSVKGGYRWNSLHTTRIQHQHFEGKNVGIPGRGEASMPQAADVTYPETLRTLTQLTHTFIPDQGLLQQSELNLFHQRIERNVRIDQLPPASPILSLHPSADHDTWGLKWLNSMKKGKHAFTLGADIWEWEMTSSRTRHFKDQPTGIDTPLADAKQLSAGVFAENNWRIHPSFSLNTGGRVDYIRAESKDHYAWIQPPSPDTPNPLTREADNHENISWDLHAGLAWNFIPRWSMTFLGASSYRSPDLMERFKYIHLGQYAVYGTPDLNPERSRFLEYGIHHVQQNLAASLSVFLNDVDDLIVEKRTDSSRHDMKNIESARIYGAEAELEYRFSGHWHTAASLAWTRGENRTEKQDLAGIPPLNGLLGIRHSPSTGLNGHLELLWATKQTRVAPEEKTTPGWTSLNAGISYIFRPYILRQTKTTHEIAFKVNNLMDTTYREHLSTGRKPAELNAPGRSLAATYTLEF